MIQWLLRVCLTIIEKEFYFKRMHDFGKILIERVDRFNVLRDDTFPGGTKARILTLLLEDIPEREIVYAGHPYGYASLALAHACERHGKTATIFFAQTNADPKPYKLTREHKSANIIIAYNVGSQSEVYETAEKYSILDQNRYLFPVGFNTMAFQSLLIEFAKSLPVNPREIWALAGSGCLVRSLKKAWGDAEINAVSLGFSHVDTGSAKVFQAPELPEQEAKHLPPYPSASYYDAKIWQFVQKYGQDDAFIWNVA